METAEAVYSDRFADLGERRRSSSLAPFDWDTLRSLTENYLAALPSAGRAEQWQDHGVDPPAGVWRTTWYAAVSSRAARRCWCTPETWSGARQEALTIDVAGEILNIRLRERVREALGGTYSINVNTGRHPDPPGPPSTRSTSSSAATPTASRSSGTRCSTR